MAPRKPQKTQKSRKLGKAKPTRSKKSRNGVQSASGRNAQKRRASNASSDPSSDEEPTDKEARKRKKARREGTVEIEENEPEIVEISETDVLRMTMTRIYLERRLVFNYILLCYDKTYCNRTQTTLRIDTKQIFRKCYQ